MAHRGGAILTYTFLHRSNRVTENTPLVLPPINVHVNVFHIGALLYLSYQK